MRRLTPRCGGGRRGEPGCPGRCGCWLGAVAAAGLFAGLRWRAGAPVTPASIVDVRDEAAAAESPPVVEPLRSAADSPSPAAAPASTQAEPVTDAARARRARPHRPARAGRRRPRPSPRPRRPPSPSPPFGAPRLSPRASSRSPCAGQRSRTARPPSRSRRPRVSPPDNLTRTRKRKRSRRKRSRGRWYVRAGAIRSIDGRGRASTCASAPLRCLPRR